MIETNRLHRVSFLGAFSALLLALTLGSIAWSLGPVIRGLGFAFGVQVTALGLIAAWLCAHLRVKIGWSLVLSISAGLAWLGISLGQLFGKLFSLYWAVTRMATLSPQAPTPTSYGLTAVSQAWEALLTRSTAVIDRVIIWLAALLQGKPIYDPLAVALVWGLLLWAVAAWAGLAIAKHKPPFLALFPGLVLQAAALWYVNQPPTGLVLFLFGMVTLIVLAGQHQRELGWQRQERDYATDLRFDVIVSTLPVAFLLMIVAAISPSLSIRSVADFIRDLTTIPGDRPNQVARSLGLNPANKSSTLYSQYRAPGLPQKHLIGSGPELSERVVMTVQVNPLPQTGANAPDQFPQDLYWKGFTYDIYTGQGWVSANTEVFSLPAGSILSMPETEQTEQVSLNITGVEDLGGILYASGDPTRANGESAVYRRSAKDIFTIGIPANHYQVETRVPLYSRSALQRAGRNYPEWIINRYTALPDSVPSRVKNLAQDLTAGAVTPYDQTRAIEGYLRQFPYTADLPAPPKDRDVTDYFLFDLKKGYCDYYATAMVVLAREIGLPARLAVGYAPGHYDAQRGLYVVTEADAHSWPEVYFPGYGWVAFEPTANREPIGDRGETSASTVPTPAVPSAPLAPFSFKAFPWTVVLGALLLASLIYYLAMRIQERAFLNRPVPVVLDRLYRQLVDTASRLSIPFRPGDTPAEFEAQVESNYAPLLSRLSRMSRSSPPVPAIRRFIDLYTQAAYSPRPLTPQQYQETVRCWRMLNTQLRIVKFFNRVRKNHL